MNRILPLPYASLRHKCTLQFGMMMMFCLLSTFGMAQTFVVTNTNDTGPGSLRDCIELANMNPDRNRIEFNIPGSGEQQIYMATSLPAISTPMVIDATTQPNGSVRLQNTGLLFQLVPSGNGTVIKGFKFFQNFRAITTQNGCSNDTISNNYFQFNSGTTIQLLGFTNSSFSNNLVFETSLIGVQGNIANSVFEGNFILNSGSNQFFFSGAIGPAIIRNNKILGGIGSAPIGLRLENCQKLLVQGNSIGADSVTNVMLAPFYGIFMGFGNRAITIGGYNFGEGNVVGNCRFGIYSAGSDSVYVIGNYVGTGLSGQQWGNKSWGIRLIPNRYNLVDGNVVGNNFRTGIRIDAGVTSGEPTTIYNTFWVKNNYVGVLPNGILVPNGVNPALFPDPTNEVLSASGIAINYNNNQRKYYNIENNIVSGNVHGIVFYSTNNSVAPVNFSNNKVGENQNGVAVGNTLEGIKVVNTSNVPVSFSGNKVVNNGANGFSIFNGQRVTVKNGSIFNNTTKAINLNKTSGTPGNSNKPTPTITDVTKLPNGDFSLSMKSDSKSDTIQVYLSNGNQSANTYLGYALISGSTWNYTYTPTDGNWKRFVITATDSVGNTSELSAPSPNCSLVVTNSADAGLGSLRDAVSCANGTPGLDTITFAITTNPVINLTTGPINISDKIVFKGQSQFLTGTDTVAITSSSPVFITNPGTSAAEFNTLKINGTGGYGIINNADTISIKIKNSTIISTNYGLLSSNQGLKVEASGNYFACDNALSISNVIYSEISNNRFNGGSSAVKIVNTNQDTKYRKSQRHVASQNFFIGQTLNSIGFTTSNNMTVAGNIFYNSNTPVAHGMLFVNGYTRDSNMVIRKNFFQSSNNGAISITKLTKALIDSNVFYDSKTNNANERGALNLNEITFSSIQNNVIKNTIGSAISTYGSLYANVFEKNILTGNSEYGIYPTYAGYQEFANVIFKENKILSNGKDGFWGYAYSASNISFLSNVFGGNGENGISLVICNSCKIRGNKFFNNGKSGLVFTGVAQDDTLIGNIIGKDTLGRIASNGEYGVKLIYANYPTGRALLSLGLKDSLPNVIANNLLGGVYVGSSNGVAIVNDSIFNNNNNQPIFLSTNSYNGKKKPTITSYTRNGSNYDVLVDAPVSDKFVHIYQTGGNPNNVRKFLGEATYDTGLGLWKASVSGSEVPTFVAIANDQNNNTSEVSNMTSPCNLVVTDTADAGPGTLREAINCANSDPDYSVITFNIPSSMADTSGRYVIKPKSELPAIINPAYLNATSQAGNIEYKIMIEGQGLFAHKDSIRIEGFWVKNLTGAGITSDGRFNSILGNRVQNATQGISIGYNNFDSFSGVSVYDTIANNELLGNEIGINLFFVSNNTIRNNYVGVNKNLIPFPQRIGIYIGPGSTKSLIIGNKICASTEDGIKIYYSSNENIIKGNFIGVVSDSISVVSGNFKNNVGLNITGVSSFNTIGGLNLGDENFISGNLTDGIKFIDGGGKNNKIIRNYIGIDRHGANVGNGQNGINILNQGGYDFNQIFSNIISFNGFKAINLNIQSPTIGGNQSKPAPTINNVNKQGNTYTLNITSQIGDSLVEVFRTDGNQQHLLKYLGNATYVSGNTWQFVYTDTANVGNLHFSATATDTLLNTSETGIDVSSCLVVTDTADAGPGTLREAINCANANPDRSFISFNIPTSKVSANGQYKIKVKSQLPFIAYPVVIDATSQPGTSKFRVKIESDGTVPFGLLVQGPSITPCDSVEISGLNIKGFAQAAIQLTPSNYSIIRGNKLDSCGSGLAMYNSGNNRIEYNVITNNTQYGIGNYGNGSFGSHIIKGNYIGVDTIFNKLPNGYGIYSVSSSNNTIGGINANEANYISANRLNGVFIVGGSNFNVLKGSYIGTNSDGVTTPAIAGLGNGENGIYINGGCSFNTIGGINAGESNYIGNNGNSGILFESGVSSNVVVGNFIGTNKNGENLGNQQQGVFVYGGSSNNTIGLPYAGNTIRYNKDNGISLSGGAAYNLIFANTISNNNFSGIKLRNGSSNALIGIPDTLFSNTIYANGEDGVNLDVTGNNSDKISANKIFNNGNKAINLNGTGIGIGGNINKKSPIIKGIAKSGLNYTLTIESQVGDTVEVFLSDGNIQNCLEYLGRASYVPSTGKWQYVYTAPQVGFYYFTATATDAQGNTSETGYQLGSGGGPGGSYCTLVTNRNNAGFGSLREAINCANADPDFDLIYFAIPRGDSTTDGAYEIKLLSQLPGIIYPVSIDGTTQFGYDTLTRYPRIRVNGQSPNGNSTGFNLLASRSDSVSIRGIEFAKGNGIGLMGNNLNLIDNVFNGIHPHASINLSGSQIRVIGNKFGTDRQGEYSDSLKYNELKVSAAIHVRSTENEAYIPTFSNPKGYLDGIPTSNITIGGWSAREANFIVNTELETGNGSPSSGQVLARGSSINNDLVDSVWVVNNYFSTPMVYGKNTNTSPVFYSAALSAIRTNYIKVDSNQFENLDTRGGIELFQTLSSEIYRNKLSQIAGFGIQATNGSKYLTIGSTVLGNNLNEVYTKIQGANVFTEPGGIAIGTLADSSIVNIQGNTFSRGYEYSTPIAAISLQSPSPKSIITIGGRENNTSTATEGNKISSWFGDGIYLKGTGGNKSKLNIYGNILGASVYNGFSGPTYFPSLIYGYAIKAEGKVDTLQIGSSQKSFANIIGGCLYGAISLDRTASVSTKITQNYIGVAPTWQNIPNGPRWPTPNPIYSYGIKIMGPLSGIASITSNIICSNTYGMYISAENGTSTDSLLIKDNQLGIESHIGYFGYGNGFAGIYVEGNSNLTIRKNKIRGTSQGFGLKLKNIAFGNIVKIDSNSFGRGFITVGSFNGVVSYSPFDMPNNGDGIALENIAAQTFISTNEILNSSAGSGINGLQVSNLTIWNNSIYQNSSYGVSVSRGDYNSIIKNRIFSNANGVYISQGQSNTQLINNQIYSNTGDGLTLDRISGTANTKILRNYIGLAYDGTTISKAGNGGNGITTDRTGDLNIGKIGVPDSGNYIGDNTLHGIVVSRGGSIGIYNNFIGGDNRGNVWGNKQHGVYVQQSAGGNTIGSDTTSGNIISNNELSGVYVLGTSNTLGGNTITSNFNDGVFVNNGNANLLTQNTIFNNANGFKAINLAYNSSNVGNAGNLPPVVTYVDKIGSKAYVKGTISSSQNLQFFTTDGNPQNAIRYLPAYAPSSNTAGQWNLTLPIVPEVKTRFVSTGTPTTINNTSELSYFCLSDTVITLTGPNQTCIGSPVTFGANAYPGATYAWDFGSGNGYSYSTNTGQSNTANTSYGQYGIDTVRVKVQFPNGCYSFAKKPINVYPNPYFVISNVLGITCDGATDGSFQFKLSADVFPASNSYTYSLDGGAAVAVTPGTDITIPNLGLGNHTLNIVNITTGCNTLQNIGIPYGGPVLNAWCITNLPCGVSGSANTNVKFNISRSRPSATGTYTYWIKDNATQATVHSGTASFGDDILQNIALTVGNVYSISMEANDNNCTSLHNAQPTSFAATALAIGGVASSIKVCYTNQTVELNPSASLNTSGCTDISGKIYTFNLYKLNPTSGLYEQYQSTKSGTQNTQNYSISDIGSFRLSVGFDPSGFNCSNAVDFAIEPESPMTLRVDTLPATCNLPNGRATVQAFGSVGNVTYTWRNASNQVIHVGSSPTDLAAGTYTVFVTDARSRECPVLTPSATAVIRAVPVVEKPTLTGGYCTATAVAQSGVPQYTFHWIAVKKDYYVTQITKQETRSFIPRLGFQTVRQVTVTTDTLLSRRVEQEVYARSYPTASSTPPADGFKLDPGKYIVYVVDGNGCVSPKDSVEVLKPSGPTTLNMCFRWKTRVEEQRDFTPPIQTSNAATIASTNTKQSLQNQVAKCKTKQLAKASEAYKQYCFNVDFLNDEVRLNYNIRQHQYTLYYYDRAGNLTKTVPPEGVNRIATAPTSRNAYANYPLATKYEYNSLQQLRQQYTPDGDTSKFLYNEVTQLRYSQNARQKADGTYSYTKYDNLSRIVEVGESSQNVFASLNNDTYLNDLTYPTANTKEQTYTVYTEPAQNISYMGQETQQYLLNRVSYTYTINVNGDTAYSYFSYDPHGNVRWLAQDIPGLSRTYTGYEYDLISNKVLKVKYNEFMKDKFFHQYSYDEDNRITAAQTSKDGILWDTDAAYDYYQHGPLRKLILGQNHVQGLDYIYTLQGWLKSINHANLSKTLDPGADGLGSSSVAPDVFGMTLGYFKGDFKRNDSPFHSVVSNTYAINTNQNLYNGNISTWVYKAGTNFGNVNDSLAGYAFRYDRLNRLRTSNFYRFDGNGLVATNGDYKMNLTYDANGNILTMKRNTSSVSSGQTEMDSLIYAYYPNTNRLQRVRDYATSPAALQDLKDQTDNENYVYDAIGNLIEDKSEGIQIQWNVYGKVAAVIPTAYDATKQKPLLRFSYDAAGHRIKKEVNLKPYANPAAAASQTVQRLPEFIQTTFYSRDASGNNMAVYERTNAKDPNSSFYVANYKQTEVPLYGSDRLGNSVAVTTVASIFFSAAESDGLSYPAGDNLVRTVALPSSVANITIYDTLNTTGVDTVVAHTFAGVVSGSVHDTLRQFQDTVSFIGRTGNNVFLAQTPGGEALFYGMVAQSYWGDTNTVLVYDSKGLLMPDSAQKYALRGDSRAKAITFRQPGSDTRSYILSPAKGKIYYSIVDLSKPGNGTVTQPLGQIVKTDSIAAPAGTNGFGFHLAAIEDRHTNSVHVFARTFQSCTGYDCDSAYVYSIRFVSGVAAPVDVRLQARYASRDSLGEGEIHVRPDAKELLIYNHKEKVGWFDHRNAELITFALDASYNLVAPGRNVSPAQKVTPALQVALRPTYPKSSATYATDSRLLLYSTHPLDSTAGVYAYDRGVRLTAPVALGADGDIRALLRNDYLSYNAGTKAGKTTQRWVYGLSGLSYRSYGLGQDSIWTGYLPTNALIVEDDVLDEVLLARYVDAKRYELKDHLGNVRVVVSDQKTWTANALASYYGAKLDAANDYYPFGMMMPGRQFTVGSYRYGYNGKEKDDEINGEGNSYDFGARIYDSRIGKFLSIDPLFREYPWNSPFAYGENKVIVGIDKEGEGFEDYLKAAESAVAGAVFNINRQYTKIKKTIDKKADQVMTKVENFVYEQYKNSKLSKLKNAVSYSKVTLTIAAEASEKKKAEENKTNEEDKLGFKLLKLSLENQEDENGELLFRDKFETSIEQLNAEVSKKYGNISVKGGGTLNKEDNSTKGEGNVENEVANGFSFFLKTELNSEGKMVTSAGFKLKSGFKIFGVGKVDLSSEFGVTTDKITESKNILD